MKLAMLLVVATVMAAAQSNPLHVLCDGWSNPWAYPGSSDCMWSWNDDQRFVREAALDGMTEAELARLAEQKAWSGAIRTAAEGLAGQLEARNSELANAARSNAMPLPGVLDAKHRAEVDRLAALSGPKFDRAFVRVELHVDKSDLKNFQTEAEAGGDKNLKGFAAGQLDWLREEVRTVKALR